MSNSIPRLRARAFAAQEGRCFYCSLPLCNGDPARFAREHTLPVKFTKTLRCTAEHLHARSEGGGNVATNIAAACFYCNHTRHRFKKPLSPEAFRKHVQGRMAEGRWHNAQVLKAFMQVASWNQGPGS
jgi:hypothetical protein